MRSKEGTSPERRARLLPSSESPSLASALLGAPGWRRRLLRLPSAPPIGWRSPIPAAPRLSAFPRPGSAVRGLLLPPPPRRPDFRGADQILQHAERTPFNSPSKVRCKAVPLAARITGNGDQTRVLSTAVLWVSRPGLRGSGHRQFAAGEAELGSEKGSDCQMEWEKTAGGGQGRSRRGRPVWQAAKTLFCIRAKSSQPAEHSTAGSFISDPQAGGSHET